MHAWQGAHLGLTGLVEARQSGLVKRLMLKGTSVHEEHGVRGDEVSVEESGGKASVTGTSGHMKKMHMG